MSPNRSPARGVAGERSEGMKDFKRGFAMFYRGLGVDAELLGFCCAYLLILPGIPVAIGFLVLAIGIIGNLWCNP